MLQAILERADQRSETGAVTASVKSFNNELGVPLTILRARPSDRFLVLEVGTNETGELARLGALVRPDLAAITNIARAHLEGLGSLQGVADEKTSLLSFLAPDATAIVPIDDGGPLRPAVARSLPPGAQIIDFGVQSGALALVKRTCLEASGLQEFTLGDGFTARLHLPGAYNVLNALAALGLARSLGIADEVSMDAFLELIPDPMRFSGEALGGSGTMLYNDAYNSNPDALKAALETFGELAADAPRRILIVGDMMELGADGPALHAEFADQLMAVHQQAPLDVVVLIGPLMRHCGDRLEVLDFCNLVAFMPKLDDFLIDSISALISTGDSVLVKGSRSMHLERVVEAIRARVDVATGELATHV
jgi:UDP-N-acetylmuramoyl-tripeptide--D-alanyl-D-alanine ligase